MKLEVQIMQQEASVNLLRSLLVCKRTSKEELEKAELRLAELLELRPKAPEPVKAFSILPKLEKPKIQQPSASPTPTLPPTDNQISLRKEIWQQIDKKKRELAEVCNSMHEVPKDAACPELMADALNLKAEEEQLWTKFRYLERNGKLPDEPEPEQKQNSLELLQAINERKKLAEKRSKLKKKLESPLNKKHRLLDRWKTELDYANLELQRLDDNIYLMKNR